MTESEKDAQKLSGEAVNSYMKKHSKSVSAEKDAHHCGESRRLALMLKDRDAEILRLKEDNEKLQTRIYHFEKMYGSHVSAEKGDEAHQEILRLRGLLERAVKLAEIPDDEWNRDLKEELISIKMELLGGGNG